MQKYKKGELGYLKYRKKLNFIKMAAAFLIVLAVLAAGFFATGTRNNVATVAAIVLVLPAAKMAVGFFVLLPHKPADLRLFKLVEESAPSLGRGYDCIFSNSKKPIGIQAFVATDHAVCALTQEENADAALFESSVQDFLANDGLKANVTLYKEEKAFLKRIQGLETNFSIRAEEKDNSELLSRNMESLLSMCL